MDESKQDFLGAFDDLWDRYRKQWKGARKEISEETVHDLRVAARRFLSLLGILRALDTHPRVKKLRRFLKKRLDSMDELHDTQVMLQETGRAIDSLPQLAAFRVYLEERAMELAGRAHKVMRATKPSDLRKRLKQIRAVAKRHADDTSLLNRLEQAVDDAHAKAVEAFGDLNSQDPATIHHVRIAFKRFRYTIEAIRPLLRGYPEDYLEKMHDYQDSMGKIRDTTVLLDALHEFAAKLPKPGEDTPAFDLQPVEAYYQQRLHDLIRAYFERKDEFNLFWRAAPDRPFPWEQSHEPVHRTARNRRAARSQ